MKLMNKLACMSFVCSCIFLIYGEHTTGITECADTLFDTVCKNRCIDLQSDMIDVCFDTIDCFNGQGGIQNCCKDEYNCFICLMMGCEN